VSATKTPIRRHVVAGAIRLHYLDWGADGRPAVVFLHGGGLNAHTWDRVCMELSKDFHCYAVDLRGHGDSEWSSTLDYSLDAHAADLIAFLDGLQERAIVLVGHSLGGHAAIRYAGMQPHRLAGLVVVDTSPFESLHDPTSRLTRVRDFVLGATEFATYEDAVAYVQQHYPERDRAMIAAALTHALRQVGDGPWTWKRDQRHLDWSYFERAIADMETLQPLVARITCPALVVRGEFGMSAADAAAFGSRLPHGHTTVVVGAGHNVQSENPDGFVAALRPFLDDAHSHARQSR